MSDEQTKNDALIPRLAQFLTRRSAALVRRGLGAALMLESGTACYDRGRAKQAIKATSAKSFISNLEGAINDYCRAIEINPRYVEAYNSRGVARFYRGDVHGAIDDFGKAIEIDPRCAKAYFNRGRAKQDDGDLDGAITDFDKVIAIDPLYANAYNSRANAKEDKGDLDGALLDFEKAIEVNPRMAHPRVKGAFRELLHYRLQHGHRRQEYRLDH